MEQNLPFEAPMLFELGSVHDLTRQPNPPGKEAQEADGAGFRPPGKAIAGPDAAGFRGAGNVSP